MSGGRWNYQQNSLGYEMFPGCDVCYGLGDDDRSKYSNYTGSVKLARKLNPMEDKQISELVFDVLCLIYSADWYKSGDTGEDCYGKDLEFFKRKWIKAEPNDMIKSEIDKAVEDARDSLYITFGLKQRDERDYE